jgi:hypothetical protein
MPTKGKRGVCGCCVHKRRRDIEIGLVCKVPLKVLSQRYDLSQDSLYRHRAHHLSAQMRMAVITSMKPTGLDLEQLARSESESLLAQLLHQRSVLQTYSSAAFEAGDIRSAVAAERAVTDALTLTSRLLGQIVTHTSHTSMSVLVSSDYIELRSALLTALKPYPAAAQAVGQALHELEMRAAQDIAAKAARRQAPLTIEHHTTDGNGRDQGEVAP